MFGLILDSTAPVFGLILLGYACGRIDLLGQHAFDVLNRFVIQLALPVLTFRILAQTHPGQFAVPAMLIAVLGGSAIVYGVSFACDIFARRPGIESNINALSASYGNGAFVGLPICLAALGPASLAPAALVIALNAAIVFSFAVAMNELLGPRHASAGSTFRKALWIALLNPVVLSAIIGIVWAAVGLTIPHVVDVFAATLGAATAPCALVAIGLFIARPQKRRGSVSTARIIVLKLAGQPLVTLVRLWLLPPLPLVWQRTAILLAAMPTGTSSFLIAAAAGQQALELSIRAIVLSTLAAVITLSVVLWLLQAAM